MMSSSSVAAVARGVTVPARRIEFPIKRAMPGNYARARTVVQCASFAVARGASEPASLRSLPMTTIYHDPDGDLSVIDGQSVAVVGYGNQGRSWAMNLRDSGFAVRVCVRADASRDQAATDGFEPGDLEDASSADIVCV